MSWAPDYATASELAAYVRVPDSADEISMTAAVGAASRAVDQACGRQFGLIDSPAARYYTARWDRRAELWRVEIDDVQTTAGLVVSLDLDESGDYGSEVDDFALRPVNAAADGRPWTHLAVLTGSTSQPTGREAEVEVVARFGWSAVPDTVKAATLLQASRFLVRRDSPYGVAGSPQTGSELRLLSKVDPDVAVMLRPYQRQWWAR